MTSSQLIIRTIARILCFFINTFAVYLLLQGHNNPGGGFIAGLVSSISIVLLYMSLGLAEVKRVIRFDPVFVAVMGLILAYGTAIAPTLLDFDFLKHSFAHWHLPLLGDVHVGTPMIFDFGVYLAVVGVTCKIILTFAYLVYEKKEFFLEETLVYSSKTDEPASSDSFEKEAP